MSALTFSSRSETKTGISLAFISHLFERKITELHGKKTSNELVFAFIRQLAVLNRH